jgi:hypothetical protein
MSCHHYQLKQKISNVFPIKLIYLGRRLDLLFQKIGLFDCLCLCGSHFIRLINASRQSIEFFDRRKQSYPRPPSKSTTSHMYLFSCYHYVCCRVAETFHNILRHKFDNNLRSYFILSTNNFVPLLPVQLPLRLLQLL